MYDKPYIHLLHTEIADKDDFLTLFLNLIGDKQGRLQREINIGNGKKNNRRLE